MSSTKAILFALKKAAPQILLYTGIGSMVGGTVMGCMASTRLNDVLAEGEVAVKKAGNDQKAIRKAKRHTAGQVAKLYLPTIALEVLGIGCVMGSDGLMLRREAGWIAAYKVLEKAYNTSRGKLENGEYYEKVEEGGEEATEATNRLLVKPVGYSDKDMGPFDEYFDVNCRLWSEDPDMTMVAIRNAMWDLNNMLQRDGHVFLNDVRRRLGYSDTPTGQKVGWILDKNDPEHHANVIDFGKEVDDILNDPSHPFRLGQQEGFVLRFHPDGVIWDKIGWH